MKESEKSKAIANFRDVGGVTTGDGRAIVHGRLYRSASFAWALDSAAHGHLVQHGVRRVIDLRAHSEVEGVEAEAAGSSVERLHIPFLQSIEQRSFQPLDRSPPATAERYYEYLLEGRASVADVLERLTAVRSRPTLLHCVAGRDRTGITIACALSLLNVPDRAIAQDYAESHVMDDEEGRQAHPDNILHLLRLIRERHGSVESLLSEGPTRELSVADLGNALLEA